MKIHVQIKHLNITENICAKYQVSLYDFHVSLLEAGTLSINFLVFQTICLLCTDTPIPPWKLFLDSLCSFSSPSFCFPIHQLNFISFLLFCFMVTNSKYCFISLKKCIFSVTFIFIFKKNIPFMFPALLSFVFCFYQYWLNILAFIYLVYVYVREREGRREREREEREICG